MKKLHTILSENNFNSIKVQLERGVKVAVCNESAKFQFHKGTIRTSPSNQVQRALAAFQFHKGTIRTI